MELENSCKDRQGQVFVAGYVENSCEGRQGRGFDCRNYVVSNQNKRFNFAPLTSKNWQTLISKS